MVLKYALIVMILAGILSQITEQNFINERDKRSLPLLFTNLSTITFISGFGIPVHYLNPELVTMGMVFRAQQFLPATLESLTRFSNHHIERKFIEYDQHFYNSSYVPQNEKNALSRHRLIFYKALEHLSMSLGRKGHICVLKMICEAATVPFHYKNGVLGDLIYILLTPSSSLDLYTKKRDNDYIEAEKHGKNGFPCGNLYQDCHESILERITNVFV